MCTKSCGTGFKNQIRYCQKESYQSEDECGPESDSRRRIRCNEQVCDGPKYNILLGKKDTEVLEVKKEGVRKVCRGFENHETHDYNAYDNKYLEGKNFKKVLRNVTSFGLSVDIEEVPEDVEKIKLFFKKSLPRKRGYKEVMILGLIIKFDHSPVIIVKMPKKKVRKYDPTGIDINSKIAGVDVSINSEYRDLTLCLSDITSSTFAVETLIYMAYPRYSINRNVWLDGHHWQTKNQILNLPKFIESKWSLCKFDSYFQKCYKERHVYCPEKSCEGNVPSTTQTCDMNECLRALDDETPWEACDCLTRSTKRSGGCYRGVCKINEMRPCSKSESSFCTACTEEIYCTMSGIKNNPDEFCHQESYKRDCCDLCKNY